MLKSCHHGCSKPESGRLDVVSCSAVGETRVFKKGVKKESKKLTFIAPNVVLSQTIAAKAGGFKDGGHESSRLLKR